MSSQLLINEPPLQVLPTLAQKIGLNEAIILQQVHYWLDPRHNKNYFEDRYWVRNTYEQWQTQFPFWAMNTIRRTVANLEETGLLMSFVTRDFKKLKYYSLNYAQLEQLVAVSEGYPSKPAENQASSPSAQNGQTDVLKSTDRRAQIGQLDRPNLGRCNNKDTETTYPENTLPPLSPPSSGFVGAKQEEEEEKPKNHLENEENPPLPSPLPCEQMLEIWNQTVQQSLYSGKPAHLTSRRRELLEVLLETVLEGHIESWHDYCILIARSKFLAGHNSTGFKATLDWALVPDNVYKVLEGAIYDKLEIVKNQPQTLTWEAFAEDLVRTLPSSQYLTPWVKISVSLAKLIGQEKYRSWFSKVSLIELTEAKASFSVENHFIKDSIVSRFTSEIRCAVQGLYPSVKQIDFLVGGAV